ncbi:MAG: 2-oxoisovalerate dehydrogenase E2 component (dihydrolipoyl transacylase) [Ilumatobacter sp.]|jgi:2-oxoisovalerate dehydrogenase E2 component (dihydrolipoyl transacylase)
MSAHAAAAVLALWIAFARPSRQLLCVDSVVLAVAELPELNAHYDHPAEMLTTFAVVHIGIAPETNDGLRAAFVHHAEQRGVAVNEMETRPVWRDRGFQPRQKLKLPSSFEHRTVNQWVPATFYWRIKRSLETPTLLFVDDL